MSRETPLMYLDHDDRMFVFASAAGAHSHPDRYYNTRVNPTVSIEIGTDTITKTAVEVGPTDRDTIYAEQARRYPQFAEYEAATDRTIPVIELR